MVGEAGKWLRGFWSNPLQFLITLAGLGLFIVIAGLVYISESPFGDIETPVSPEKASRDVKEESDNRNYSSGLGFRETLSVAEKADSQTQVRPVDTSKYAQARNAIIRDDLSQLVAKAASDLKLLETLVEELNSLEINDLGKRLAQSRELVTNYMVYKDAINTLSSQIVRLNSEFALLESETADHLAENPLMDLPPTVSRRARDLAAELKPISDEIKSRKIGIAALTNKATLLSAGSATLSQTLETLYLDKEDFFLKEKSRLKEQLEQERQANELAAFERTQRAKMAYENELRVAEERKLLSEAQALAISTEESEKKRKLQAEMERDMPKINFYLSPLFIKSTRQPSSGSDVETADAMPVSFHALSGRCLTGKSIDKSLEALLLFFSYDQCCGRGRGAISISYNGGALNPDERAAIRPVYDLIVKYGNLLVEAGHLAP